MGTTLPSNSQHENASSSPSRCPATPKHLAFGFFGSCCWRRRDSKNSAACSSLQFLRSAMSFRACCGVSLLTVGGEYAFFFMALGTWYPNVFDPFLVVCHTFPNSVIPHRMLLRNTNTKYLKHCIDNHNISLLPLSRRTIDHLVLNRYLGDLIRNSLGI